MTLRARPGVLLAAILALGPALPARAIAAVQATQTNPANPAAPALAVGAGGRATADPGATPLLPPGHWVFPVLGRLDALGALPAEYDPTAPTWTVGHALHALERAGESAGGAAVIGLARAAADAMAAEAGGAGHGERALLPGWVAAVHAASAGAPLAGYDTAPGAPGVAPAEAADRRELAAEARLALRAAPWLAAELVPAVGSAGVRLAGAHVVARPSGAFVVWAGRRSVAMVPAAGSPGLILGTPHRLDGAGAALAPGRTPPRPLAWLGPVNLDAVVTRVGSAGATPSPWLWALRGSVRPHPRLRLALERAGLIGGEGNVPVGPRQVLEALAGTHGDSSAVDNQVLALDAWYRPPVGSLPLAVYLSWAMDDNSGAWVDVPAYAAGVRLAAVPGLPAVALAVERVSFTASCCGNPPWYRHLELPWLDGRRPLGHPLAGHGDEWRARGRLDLPGRGLLTSLEAYSRDRGHENPLAPDRAGSSRGLELRFRLRPPGRGLEIASTLGLEVGEADWRMWDSELAVRLWSW